MCVCVQSGDWCKWQGLWQIAAISEHLNRQCHQQMIKCVNGQLICNLLHDTQSEQTKVSMRNVKIDEKQVQKTKLI